MYDSSSPLLKRAHVYYCNGKEERTCRAHPFNSTDAQHVEVCACTVSAEFCLHALGPVKRLSARFVDATLGEQGERTLFVSSPLFLFCRTIAYPPQQGGQQRVVRTCNVGSRPLCAWYLESLLIPWDNRGGAPAPNVICQFSAKQLELVLTCFGAVLEQ